MARLSRTTLATLAMLAALSLMLALPAAGSGAPAALQPDRATPWDAGAAEAAGATFGADLWFVEFRGTPGRSAVAHAAERRQFRDEAAGRGVRFSQRRSFTELWNGLSVQASPAEAGRLAGLSSVRAVYPVELVSIPDTTGLEPQLATALTMTGADAAQSELGLSGAGISVAVMDTGIDYQHPDLGGDGPGTAFPSARVTHGFDFVGDDYNAASDDPARHIPHPDPDPMDVNGHGTHVSGIVGASSASADGVTGVAPDVTFGAYKVFGTEGSTTADILIEAMEMAIEDGMDILNMSLGRAFSWPQYPTATASDALVAEGMVVVASAGNSGASGVYSGGSPALGHDVIAVASADNTFIRANSFSMGDAQIPWIVLSGADSPPTAGESAPLQLVGNHGVVDEDGNRLVPGDATSLGCNASDFAGFTPGNVAVIMRAECTFALKHLNALNAGASGVLIYNNIPGLFAGGGDFQPGAWGVGTSDTAGLLVAGTIQASEDDVTLTFSDERIEAPNPSGGLASSFTAYGHSPDLTLKPDVMAPGGLITSTYPIASGSYATISGTSMSSPHVAGAVALLLEAHPDLEVGAVRDRLQNTATPSNWSLNPGLGLLDHTYRQGAGMIQIDDAVLATTGLSPGKVSLGAGTGPHDATVTVSNWGDDDVTYSVSHVNALQTAGSTFTPGFFLAAAGYSGPSSVTVEAGDSADVTFTITPPAAGLANHQFGGYVVLTDAGGDAPTLRVPYGGFAGEYDMPVLGFITNTAGDVQAVDPVLARSVDFVLEPAGDDPTFRVVDGDNPIVAAFLGHQAQYLEMIAHDPERDRSWVVHTEEYLTRSGGFVLDDHYLPFEWDGQAPAGASQQTRPVPHGFYELEIRVLRALGDPDDPAHWESWSSGEFYVETRPGH